MLITVVKTLMVASFHRCARNFFFNSNKDPVVLILLVVVLEEEVHWDSTSLSSYETILVYHNWLVWFDSISSLLQFKEYNELQQRSASSIKRFSFILKNDSYHDVRYVTYQEYQVNHGLENKKKDLMKFIIQFFNLFTSEFDFPKPIIFSSKK